MSTKKPSVAILLLLIIFMTACGSSPANPDSAGEEGNSEPATAAAVTHLAHELGVSEDEIEVVSTNPAEFTDSCLGLGGPTESCLQAITPGWIVMLSAAGTGYEVHTDETGEQVRIAAAEPEGDSGADTAAAAAQEFLVGELGVALGDVQIVSSEPTEFSDSCLGLGGPAESCLQVITPGWIIMAEVAGQSYEVHVDETGQQVRVAE